MQATVSLLTSDARRIKAALQGVLSVYADMCECNQTTCGVCNPKVIKQSIEILQKVVG
jgi:hypothetical protein